MAKDRVSIEDLETAAAWLQYNEGLEGEMESCERVAAWLLREVTRRNNTNMRRNIVRALAHENNVPETIARIVFKAKEKNRKQHESD